TQATVSPNSEKHAPDTRPTYPVPIIAIRIRSPARFQCSAERRRGGLIPPPGGGMGVLGSDWTSLERQARMSRSVLVTGGAGYIGSHACKVLARAGHQPIVFDNLSRGHREAVRWGPLVEGDLADRERLVMALRAHGVSAIMNF